MALTPQQIRASRDFTLQIIGLALIALGVWAWSQPDDSILLLAVMAGVFPVVAHRPVPQQVVKKLGFWMAHRLGAALQLLYSALMGRGFQGCGRSRSSDLSG